MSDTLRSPARIKALLEFYTTRHPVVGDELRDELLALGLIYLADGGKCYKTTQMGNAWVKALCRMPAPRQVFIDQEGNELT